MLRNLKRPRLSIQVLFTALTNSYLPGYAEGRIFTGNSKAFCLPGLNCYSCPGALGSCPIGAIQAVLGSRNFQFTFYLTGFLTLVGAFLGRLVCGWLCPFGLFQDLLHRIPFYQKWKKLPGDRGLRLLKYILLVVFVILLPMFVVDLVGQGSPWFCKWICPSGTLMAGLPILAVNEPLRDAAGWLFAWKVLVLAVVVFLSVLVYRPFCRYLCPLGAIYGLFNRFALYRFRVDPIRCTSCGSCQKACKFEIPTWKQPNSPECIRCGDCLSACPHLALTATLENPGAVHRSSKETI